MPRPTSLLTAISVLEASSAARVVSSSDRERVVEGKRGDFGGCRIIKKKKKPEEIQQLQTNISDVHTVNCYLFPIDYLRLLRVLNIMSCLNVTHTCVIDDSCARLRRSS